MLVIWKEGRKKGRWEGGRSKITKEENRYSKHQLFMAGYLVRWSVHIF